MAETSIRFRNRETGRIEEERVFGENWLRFFYESVPGRLLTWAALKRPLPNRLYGLYKAAPFTRDQVASFVETFDIDAAEAEKPLEAYRSLNEFFVRRLRPDARPIDPNPDHLVSPADGRCLIHPVTDGTVLPIKGRPWTVDELLDDPDLAAPYAGGTAIVLRLAPSDYHRFHFPDDGRPGLERSIPGDLHSIHPISLAAGAPVFARNRRDVTFFDSRGFGRMAIVEVGALCVGTIVQTFVPHTETKRGAEKGYFAFGGSTVVLLIEPDRVRVDEDLVQTTKDGLETLVRMGTRIGCR